MSARLYVLQRALCASLGLLQRAFLLWVLLKAGSHWKTQYMGQSSISECGFVASRPKQPYEALGFIACAWEVQDAMSWGNGMEVWGLGGVSVCPDHWTLKEFY